jgi:hypothetical protein
VAERHAALAQCPNCGHEVPAGAYCGHCGVSMTPGAARARRHAYAASPTESVYHVGLGSTLFPHLARGQGVIFTWGLLGGVAVIVALTAFNLFPAAAAVAVLLLPVLYLLYLYETRVYAGQPWLVLALAFLLPLVLGSALNAVLGSAITSLALEGDRSLLLFLEVVVAPVLALAAAAVGPVVLLSRTASDDVLDAVVFGATSGLAFSLGATGVAVWPLLTGRVVSEGVPAQWTLLLLRQGILFALLSMATASLLSAAFWLWRRGARKRLEDRWLWSLPAVVVAALVVRVAAALLGLTPRLLLEVLAVLVLLFLLFLYLRLVVHHALLEEAVELEIGPPSPCPDCHRVVPTMVFCPACGMSRSAAAKKASPSRAGTDSPQRTREEP